MTAVPPPPHPDRLRSSRQRYKRFLDDYKHGRLDQRLEVLPAEASRAEGTPPVVSAPEGSVRGIAAVLRQAFFP